jgi:hypothetical protein
MNNRYRCLLFVFLSYLLMFRCGYLSDSSSCDEKKMLVLQELCIFIGDSEDRFRPMGFGTGGT